MLEGAETLKGKRLVAVDLFCGVGGLTRGLLDAGIAVVAGIDSDPACRYPYEHNNASSFLCKDVAEVKSDDITALYPQDAVRVLAGCAPCQPFSTYTQGRELKTKPDWDLLNAFARIVKEVLPDIVTMENVPTLQKHAIFAEFVSTLKGLGYFVSANVAYGPAYGVPQTRRRLVILASKFGPISITQPIYDSSSYPSVRGAISGLEKLSAGQVSATDRLHRAQGLSPRNLQRIRTSRPGGTWRDWEADLIAPCHTKASGETYPGVYGRMEWDGPAPTITTQCYGFGSGRFGHPDQDRAISLREAALLQTFREDYDFVEPDKAITFKKVGRLIGNAVPVKLAEAIGRSIIEHTEIISGSTRLR